MSFSVSVTTLFLSDKAKRRQKRTEGAEESRHTECAAGTRGRGDSDRKCLGISVALRGHTKKVSAPLPPPTQPATIGTIVRDNEVKIVILATMSVEALMKTTILEFNEGKEFHPVEAYFG